MIVIQYFTDLDDPKLSAAIRTANATQAKRLGVEYRPLEGGEKAALDALLSALETDGERVLFLNGRAAIYPSGLDLDAEFSSLLGDRSVLFASDVGGEETRWNPKRPNASQAFLKASDDSRRFVAAWRDAFEKAQPVRLRLQNALWKIRRDFDEILRVEPDYWRFAARRGYAIRNFYLGSNEEALSELRGADALDKTNDEPLETKGSDDDGNRIAGRGGDAGEPDRTALGGTENESPQNGSADDSANVPGTPTDSGTGRGNGNDSGEGGAGAGGGNGTAGTETERAEITDAPEAESEPEPPKKRRSVRKKKDINTDR